MKNNNLIVNKLISYLKINKIKYNLDDKLIK